ncbi:MAG: hypothetical protein ACOYX1_04260 [Acidobacteriota bacterium]
MPPEASRQPQTLDELRSMITPEMWADLRRAAPLVRRARQSDFPDRLILPRSFCLGFAAQWGLPSDPETVSGLVHLLYEAAGEPL